MVCVYVYYGDDALEQCTSWICHAFEQKSVIEMIIGPFRRRASPSQGLLDVRSSLTRIINEIGDAKAVWYSKDQFFDQQAPR